MLGATEEGDLLASRRDGSGTFSKIEALLQHDRPLGRRFQHPGRRRRASLRAAPCWPAKKWGWAAATCCAATIIASDPATTASPPSVELRYDLPTPASPVKAAQLYAYADAGLVDNRGGGFGDGSLGSAGGGVRFSFGKLDGSLELGFPLERRFLGDRSPRLSFTLGNRF